ncbi:DUF1150 family protein [Profundibacter sp.]|uniref:DUF1150 family protein n=1 Tax=Profundibacter sp. TaxID=3101071 RepID=UPI003D12756E
MDTPFDFGIKGNIVYIKPVDVADLPKEVRDEVGDLKQMYAVFSAEGEQLALVRDRNMAFFLARQNDLAPVTVH